MRAELVGKHCQNKNGLRSRELAADRRRGVRDGSGPGRRVGAKSRVCEGAKEQRGQQRGREASELEAGVEPQI